MIHVFHSNFKSYIEGVIEQKHAIGYSYKIQAYMLRCFDRFCIEHYPQETVLTKEIALQWAELRDEERAVSLEGRISPIRQLAKYITALGSKPMLSLRVFQENVPAICRISIPTVSFRPFLQKPTNANMTKEVRQDISCFQ